MPLLFTKQWFGYTPYYEITAKTITFFDFLFVELTNFHHISDFCPFHKVMVLNGPINPVF